MNAKSSNLCALCGEIRLSFQNGTKSRMKSEINRPPNYLKQNNLHTLYKE
jgi:hypothetical protein